jgi:hypothetical protein
MFPNGLESQYSREVFFNRLMYMINELHTASRVQGGHTTPNLEPNAGKTIFHMPPERKDLGTALMEEAMRKGERGRLGFDPTLYQGYISKIPTELHIPFEQPQMGTLYNHAIEIARNVTALETGYIHNIEGLSMRMKSSMDSFSMGRSSDSSLTTADQVIKKGSPSAQILKDKIGDSINEIHKLSQLPGMGNLGASLDNIMANVQGDPMQFIRFDLYQKPDEIGILSNRQFDEDFFDENTYAKVEEALYHYNQGGDGQSKYVGFTEEEDEFRKFLQGESTSYHGSDYTIGAVTKEDMLHLFDEENADKIVAGLKSNKSVEFRDAVVKMNQGIDGYISGVESDRKKIREIKSILQEAGKGASDQEIIKLLKEDKRFKDLEIAQYVLDASSDTGNTHDKYARHMMRLYMQSRDTLPTNPVYLASSVTESNTLMAGRLNEILYDSYQTDSANFAGYQRMRSLKSGYFRMTGQLNETRQIANAESLLYVGNRDDSRRGVFEDEEAKNMYRESNRVSRIIAENDEAYERHVAAIEEFEDQGKDRPKQPVNRFRGAFVHALMEENEVMGAIEEDAMRESIKSADRQLAESQAFIDNFDEKLYTGEELKRQKEIVKRHERIVKNKGLIDTDWMTPRGLDTLREVLADEDTRVASLQEKGVNTNSRDSWTQAKLNGDRIRLSGSEVGYEITSMNENYVTLKADSAQVRDTTIRLDIPDEGKLDEILAQLNERKIRSEISQDSIKEINDRVITESFINIRYDQKRVSQELKNTHEFVFEKIKEAETFLESKGMFADGVQEINVPGQDIGQVFNAFRKNVSELDDKGIKRRMTMPKFLMRMAESHAPFMLNDTAKLVSDSELALREVIDDMAKKNQTLDLTDEGLEKEWRRFAEVDDIGELTEVAETEFKAFRAGLAEKGLTDRLEDSLFMRVLGQMIQNNFAENPTNDSMRNFVTLASEAFDGLDREGNARDIYSLLRSDSVRELYKEHGHYTNALQLSPTQIDEILNESGMASNYTVSLDAMRESGYEAVRDSDYGGLMNDYNNMDYEVDDLKQEQNQRLYALSESMTGDPEQDFFRKEALLNHDGMDYSDEVKNAVANSYEKIAKEENLAKLREGMKFTSIEDVDLMLDMAKELGQDSVYGAVQGQEALIYRGKKGDVIAHLQEDNVKVQLTDINPQSQKVERLHYNDQLPQIMYGEAGIKEDVGNGGVPTRQQYTSYQTIQGSGKYAISSNPSVSIDTMQDFLRGKGKLTYMDIETTGLDGSTIDPKYLQPIEVYMQKVEWDTENNTLRRNADGDYSIRHAGRETVRDLHLFTSLTEDTKGFMKDLIDNEDFTFDVGGEQFSLLDYERNPLEIDKKISSQGTAAAIRESVKGKQDKMWFLRNIAKYAFPGDELDASEVQRYQMYAGNMKLPHGKEGASFVSQLKADAQAASDFLDKVGVGNGRTVYSPGQVGTSLEGMVKHVSRFVGKGGVIGQNVADADWAKFIKIADEGVAASSTHLTDLEESLVPKAQEARDLHFQNLLNDMDSWGQQMEASKEITRQNRKSINRMTSRMRDYMGQGNSFENSDAFFDHAAKISGKNESVKDLVEQTRTSADEARQYDRTVNWLSGNDHIRPDNLVGLGEEDIQRLQSAESKLDQARNVRNAMPKPDIVEQQYLYSLSNPNASGRSAEAQFDAMGIQVDDEKGLHTAKTDVKSHLQLVDQYGQMLSGDSEFMNFQHEPLQSGDFVEMHRKVNKDMPLGMYQVDNVDMGQNQIQMSHVAPDGTSQSFTVHGASNADLSRKMESSFSFMGTSAADETVQQGQQRILEDHARRQMARASDSGFTFDLYEGEMKELAGSPDDNLTHESLRNMKELYDAASVHAKDGQNFTNPNTFENVALRSAELFEGNGVLDLLDKQASPMKKAAYDLTQEWMATPEGQRRKSFLNEVTALEDTGAIDKRTSRDLIRQWNESIKEEGFKRGAKHTVFNKANLGVLDESFGALEGKDWVVSHTDPSRLGGDIMRMAERTKGLVNQSAGEQAAKEKALNSIVLPYLQKQGFLPEFDPKSPPKLPSVINQLMKSDKLTPHEEYDFLKSGQLSQDDSFMEFMDKKASELLDPVQENLTTVQQAKVTQYGAMKDELIQNDMYHPALTIQPNLTGEDIARETMNFSKYGGISNTPTGRLVEAMDMLDTPFATQEEKGIRNTLAGEVFNRATRGQDVDIDDVIRRGDSDQLRAMEGLNWIKRADAPERVGDTIINMPVNGYVQNTDVASHIFGAPGKHAGTRMGMMPLDLLDSIADRKIEKYTRGDGLTTVMNKVQGWKQAQYEGRYPAAPDRTVRENLKQAVQSTKEQGQRSNPRTQRESGYSPSTPVDNTPKYIPEIVPPDTNYEHRNVISDTMRHQYDNAKNWATSVNDLPMGKAAKWIGGLGIAAFALHQFANASSPVRLERQPQAHGVEGPTGQPNDGITHGDQGNNPSPAKPNTGGTVYADAGEGQKGYRVKVKGEANQGIDTTRLQKEIDNQMSGSAGVNLNVTDSRQSLDRSWLEEQFSNFIDRGHAE